MSLASDIWTLIILLFLSGFFSGAEVALVSLSRAKAKMMLQQKKWGANYVVDLVDNQQRMLATILIGNNLVNVAASALTTALMIQWLGSVAIGVATGVMTILILIFGELTPKTIAAQKNVLVAQIVGAPIWYLSKVFAPVLQVLELSLNNVLKLFGFRPEPETITEEEIISMLKTAEEEGSIKEIEKKMINSIFEFDDIAASEIATPRKDIAMIDAHLPIKDAIKIMLEHGYSRMPVYENKKDHVIGIAYVKDLLKQITIGKSSEETRTVVREPYYVPGSKKLSNLLKQFQKRKEHLALVVDEHGAITGLVTLEDVLEEIVGEIIDETDKIAPHIKKVDRNVWMVSGKTDVDEVNETLRMDLKTEDYDTLSGFILDRTGHIPKVGEEVHHNNFKLKIEEIDGQRIIMVRVTQI